MNKEIEDAYKLVASVCEKVNGTFDTHMKIQEALQTISDALSDKAKKVK